MNNSQPIISVIIPTYNRGHLIERSIHSVLSQTYRDFELIIVDDGSTDNTAEIIRSYNDDRVRYIRHDTNMGVAVARNTGIKAALHDYIAFQDSDDQWFTDKLAKQIAAFDEAGPEVGVVYSGVWYIEGARKRYVAYPDSRNKDGDLHKSLLKLGYICFMASVIRKECFERAGLFDETLPASEDWEMWIRISRHYHFKCVDEPVGNVYCAPGTLSTNYYAYHQALYKILNKHIEDFKSVTDLYSRYSSAVGIYLCLTGRYSQGREYIANAIRSNPINIVAWIAAVTSLLGEQAFCKIVISYAKVRGHDLSHRPDTSGRSDE